MHENQDVNIVSRDNIKPLIQFCELWEQVLAIYKEENFDLGKKIHQNEESTRQGQVPG